MFEGFTKYLNVYPNIVEHDFRVFPGGGIVVNFSTLALALGSQELGVSTWYPNTVEHDFRITSDDSNLKTQILWTATEELGVRTTMPTAFYFILYFFFVRCRCVLIDSAGFEFWGITVLSIKPWVLGFLFILFVKIIRLGLFCLYWVMGQNGPIPQFLEIFSKKTLFRK